MPRGSEISQLLQAQKVAERDKEALEARKKREKEIEKQIKRDIEVYNQKREIKLPKVHTGDEHIRVPELIEYSKRLMSEDMYKMSLLIDMLKLREMSITGEDTPKSGRKEAAQYGTTGLVNIRKMLEQEKAKLSGSDPAVYIKPFKQQIEATGGKGRVMTEYLEHQGTHTGSDSIENPSFRFGNPAESYQMLERGEMTRPPQAYDNLMKQAYEMFVTPAPAPEPAREKSGLSVTDRYHLEKGEMIEDALDQLIKNQEEFAKQRSLLRR
jgi:hypothetical protein